MGQVREGLDLREREGGERERGMLDVALEENMMHRLEYHIISCMLT